MKLPGCTQLGLSSMIFVSSLLPGAAWQAKTKSSQQTKAKAKSSQSTRSGSHDVDGCAQEERASKFLVASAVLAGEGWV